MTIPLGPFQNYLLTVYFFVLYLGYGGYGKKGGLFGGLFNKNKGYGYGYAPSHGYGKPSYGYGH